MIKGLGLHSDSSIASNSFSVHHMVQYQVLKKEIVHKFHDINRNEILKIGLQLVVLQLCKDMIL